MTPFRMTKPSARIASAAASRCAGSILPPSFSVEEIAKQVGRVSCQFLLARFVETYSTDLLSAIISPCHERLLPCWERGHSRGPGRRRPVLQQSGAAKTCGSVILDRKQPGHSLAVGLHQRGDLHRFDMAVTPEDVEEIRMAPQQRSLRKVGIEDAQRRTGI